MSATSFITEWNMPAASFTLPLRSGYTYDFIVDWGDGSPTSHVTAYNDAAATHVYAVAGTYQIDIDGTCGAWYINYGAIRLFLTKIIQWGDVNFSALGLAAGFYGCSNLNSLPDGPITGANAATTFSKLFAYTGITYIPNGFFDNTLLVNNYSEVFSNCLNLETAPDLLFPSTIVSYFILSKAFYECKKLKLNKNLFFAPGEESTRFASQNLTLLDTFRRTSYTNSEKGEAPPIWNCTVNNFYSQATCFAGSGNSIDTILNYCFIPNTFGSVGVCAKLESIGVSRFNDTHEKVSITTTAIIPPEDTFNCYVSTDYDTLINPENLVAILKISDYLYEAIAAIDGDGVNFYVHIDYTDGLNPEILDISGKHYTVDQVDDTIINITDPTHYIDFFGANPAHKFNHGLIYYNGFIYGSARNKWEVVGGEYSGTGLFKVKADDYSQLTQVEFWDTHLGDTKEIAGLDQIVECNGFLWAVGFSYYKPGGILLRINPEDLSYIAFFIGAATMDTDYYGQPIGTDGEFLFYSGAEETIKINTSLLLSPAQTYNYQNEAVLFPENTIIGTCANIQPHATQPAYSHSILIDATHIYNALTTGYSASGYLNGDPIYCVQKINKNTMQSEGYVPIPRCTDDMVDNGPYLFLCPEIPTNAETGYPGENWGFIAINKLTLEIKYLKALHSDFDTNDTSDRMGYGVFYFNNYVTIQLVTSKKTVVISLDNIEQWGEDFPIGGATEGIYSFQINGVDVALPPNELVLDPDNWVHINTWGEETQLFKFPLEELNITYLAPEPIIQTTLISSDDANATVQGAILDTGQSAMTSVGFLYGTDPESLTTNVPSTLETTFEETLLSLTAGIYYIQAWGINTEGTWYGNIVIFSTYNVMELSYDSEEVVLDYIDKRHGCSIRCVQDAPGELDGTMGIAYDNNGYQYNTIIINEKRWFTRNLYTTKDRNRDDIQEVVSNSAWATLSDERALCAYNNDWGYIITTTTSTSSSTTTSTTTVI